MKPETLSFIESCIKTIPDYPKPGILFRDITSLVEAKKIARSWNYNDLNSPIPLGKFYQVDAPRFDQAFSGTGPLMAREDKISSKLESFI